MSAGPPLRTMKSLSPFLWNFSTWVTSSPCTAPLLWSSFFQHQLAETLMCPPRRGRFANPQFNISQHPSVLNLSSVVARTSTAACLLAYCIELTEIFAGITGKDELRGIPLAIFNASRPKSYASVFTSTLQHLHGVIVSRHALVASTYGGIVSCSSSKPAASSYLCLDIFIHWVVYGREAPSRPNLRADNPQVQLHYSTLVCSSKSDSEWLEIRPNESIDSAQGTWSKYLLLPFFERGNHITRKMSSAFALRPASNLARATSVCTN